MPGLSCPAPSALAVTFTTQSGAISLRLMWQRHDHGWSTTAKLVPEKNKATERAHRTESRGGLRRPTVVTLLAASEAVKTP